MVAVVLGKLSPLMLNFQSNGLHILIYYYCGFMFTVPTDFSTCADPLSGPAFLTIVTVVLDTQMVSSQNSNNSKLTLLFRPD